MSTISSSLFLLILLLFLAVSSCDARPSGHIKKEDDKTRKSSHFLSKDEEKLRLARVSVSPDVNGYNHHKELKAAKKENGARQENAVNNNNKLKKEDEKRQKVSWNLPHPQRGEQQPGFNLDYEPPRTYPGLHN